MEKWVSINYGVENKREKWKTEGLILRSTCWMEMGDDQLVTCECVSLKVTHQSLNREIFLNIAQAYMLKLLAFLQWHIHPTPHQLQVKTKQNSTSLEHHCIHMEIYQY